MTVKELYDSLKRILGKDEVNIYFCPSRDMEEMPDGEWRWKDCVEVGDTDLERICTDDGLGFAVERNLVLLPEE